jgi:hypothetical protein
MFVNNPNGMSRTIREVMRIKMTRVQGSLASASHEKKKHPRIKKI